MKKLDQLIEQVDKEVDRRLQPWNDFFGRYFTFFSSIFFSFLLIFFVFKVYYEKPNLVASLIQSDIKNIHYILSEIDKKCFISHVKKNCIPLDFFTVVKFVGSEIGGLNLRHPERWQGPYMKDCPEFQLKAYELIRARDGFFIIPGFDTKLPNGFIVGRDFDISEQTFMLPLLKEGGPLFYKGFVFGERIIFSCGACGASSVVSDETIKKIDDMLKEFNNSIPLSKNEEVRHGWN